ncbi:MAG: 6-phospho-3-hexuloisomerase, partial [Promethearchaeota archaeon]
ETITPVAIAQEAKKIGGKIALLTANINSTIGKLSDCIIKIEGKSKDVAIVKKTLAPYTSLFDISTLAVLDSIGGVLMDILSITEIDIYNRHASLE